MGRKCSAYGCNTGYAESTKRGFDNDPKPKEKATDFKPVPYLFQDKPNTNITVFRFPDDPNTKVDWVKALPNEMKVEHVTKWMGVCAMHFPPSAKVKYSGGKLVPDEPPSINYKVKKSCLPSKAPTPRETTNSTTSSRNIYPDQMPEFLKSEPFIVSSFVDKLKKTISKYDGHLVWGKGNSSFIFMSNERDGPVSKFHVHFTIDKIGLGGEIKSFLFEAYHGLKRVRPKSLYSTLRTWSQLEELLRFVCIEKEDVDDKWMFLYRQIELLNSINNRTTKVYLVSDFLTVFPWYTISRSLYKKLREFWILPSVSTLQKLTRISKNKEDDVLFLSFFDSQEMRCRVGILIIDEIYVKASLSYKSGTLVGYAADCDGKLAKTILCVMFKCFFTKKKFLVKLLPCSNLTAQYQFNSATEVVIQLEKCGATVLGLICDNNRVNESFFKFFTCFDPSEPWLVHSPGEKKHPFFLMYDPVHLLKNIRNNWHTDKTQTISYSLSPDGIKKEAHWDDLKDLYDLEQKQLVKMSKLTKSSVFPNGIQKQNVQLALNVFCEQTSSALKSSTNSSCNWHATADFIDLVVRLWKLFNCKGAFQAERHRDPDRMVILEAAASDPGYSLLLDWGKFSFLAPPEKGEKTRQKTLTKNTSDALAFTCNSLAALSKHLLETNECYKHDYVCLGFFQQDAIEHHFGHFRMSHGCNFFLTAGDVMFTHNLDRTQFMLEHSESEMDITGDSTHSCNLCDIDLTDLELLILDDLRDESISSDEKMSLFYISGYVASKHPNLAGAEDDFPEEAKRFLSEIDRGGLTYPSVELFDFACLACLFFKSSDQVMCRKRLIFVLKKIPEIFNLDISLDDKPLRRFANIFFKRFSQKSSTENVSNKHKIDKLKSV